MKIFEVINLKEESAPPFISAEELKGKDKLPVSSVKVVGTDAEDLDDDDETYDTMQTQTLVAGLQRSAAIRTEDSAEDTESIDNTKLQGLALRDLLKKK